MFIGALNHWVLLAAHKTFHNVDPTESTTRLYFFNSNEFSDLDLTDEEVMQSKIELFNTRANLGYFDPRTKDAKFRIKMSIQ